MPDTLKPRIFLSYARRDGQAAADTLRARLADRAHTSDAPLPVWQDLTSMRSGDWREQIRAAIKTGDHLLMVVTLGALASEVCAWEWLVARLEGAEISPVLLGNALRRDDLPKWMRAQHVYRLDLDAPDFALADEWQGLVASLREPPRSRRMPIVTREPGDRFVPRLKKMDALRDMLLDANGDAIGVTTAFAGSGGMGKTTLALALARDPQIQSAFYHGQLLIELGQTPDLKLALTSAIRELTGETSAAQYVSEAASELAKALANRCVLLVIDDVWDSAHLKHFLHDQSALEQRGCARLVTTRNVETLPSPRPGAQRRQVDVDEMSPAQAMSLLENGLPVEQVSPVRTRLVALAKRLGHCAQVIDLARGRLASRIFDGWPLDGALDDAEISYGAHGIDAFDNSSSSAREDSYARCITASLDILTAEQKARFLELAILPEDTDVPYGTIALLWADTAGMAETDVAALLDRLRRTSLVKGSGTFSRQRDTRAIRLHDVIRVYLRDRGRQTLEQLKELNRRMWFAHVQAGERAFADGTTWARYGYEWLPWHLNEAEEKHVLDALLLDPNWMQGKLNATSIQKLQADYERWAPQHHSVQGLIRRTLRLAAGPIGRDKRQLLPQLHARLLGQDAEGLSLVLDRMRARADRPIVLLRYPSLTPPSAEIARLEGHKGPVYALEVLADGSLVSGSADRSIRQWDTNRDLQLSAIDGHSQFAIEIRSKLASLIEDYRIAVEINANAARPNSLIAKLSSNINVTKKLKVTQPTGHADSVTALALLSDGGLATASQDRSVRLWDITTSTERLKCIGHTGTVLALSVLSDGRLVSSSRDRTIRIWDAATGTESLLLKLVDTEARTLAMLTDGRIASGCDDGTIRVWDTRTGLELKRLIGHTRRVNAIVTQCNYSLASGSDDGTVRHWNLGSATEVAIFEGKESTYGKSKARALALLADGRVAVGWSNSNISILDLATNTEAARLEGHSRGVNALRLLPSGVLASASDDETIRLWDVEHAPKAHQRKRGYGRFTSSVVLPDGLSAYNVGGTPPIHVVDSAGAEFGQLIGHVQGVAALLLLPDGRLASGGENIRLWNVAELKENARLETDASVNALAVLQDNRIASASDRTVVLWDVPTLTEIGRLVGPRRNITALAALPDGQLASAGDDHLIQLWDVEGKTSIAVLRGHTAPINALALLANGRLASGSNDKTIRIWDLQERREIARFELEASVHRLETHASGHLVADDEECHRHVIEVLE